MPRRSLALLAVLASAPIILAQDKSNQLDRLITRYHDLGLFNGSALVAQGGKPILRKGYGEANMEWHIANTPDTRFRLGSITKQFTATLVMQLVEQGKIDLSAPITRYLPDYPKTNGDRITIKHLLTHTSGIPGYTELPGFGKTIREPFSPTDLMKTFSSLDLLFEPGTKYSYSNSGFFVLGVILERVTGEPYEQLLRERIFDPLGMNESGYDHPGPLIEKRAAGYDKTMDGYVNTSYLDMSQPYSAGSLYSSVDDLLKWDQALYTDKVLSPESKRAMFTPGLGHYGFGWFISTGAITTTDHGGGINGFNTYIARDLEAKRLFVLLNNTGGAPLEEMVTSLRNILDGKPVTEPKLPSASVLLKTSQASGLQAALDQWKSMKSGTIYDTTTGELFRFVGALLEKDKPLDAIAVLKEAEAADPKSAYVAEAQGNAEDAANHRVEAVQAFSRAMVLSDTPRAFPILMDRIRRLSVDSNH